MKDATRVRVEALKRVLIDDNERLLIESHKVFMERKRLLAQGKLKTTGIVDFITGKEVITAEK